MVLPYNNNTPLGNVTIASTQNAILTNFQSLDSAFNGQTGGGSGGGNFTTYSLQNTTASFVSKPVNPIGVLHTIASTNGNPELAWINNVDSVGAGPYTGTQLTGGGVTAGAWVHFNGSTAVINSSFNITSVVRNSAGNYTITFTRNFTATTYAACVSCFSQNSFPISWKIVSPLVGSFQFANFVYNATPGPISEHGADPSDVSILFFGTLV